MDVFVIPLGADRYELYCEQPFSSAAPTTASSPTGAFGRLRHRFEDLLRRAEQWEPAAEPARRTLFERLHDKSMAWVAERVVEQRLLWNLRRETTVTTLHPDDLSADQVQRLVQRLLQHDAERHQYWACVDGVLFVVTFVALGPLFLLIPGIANLPAIYFGFRTVGHWYSRGGAKHGLRSVSWAGRPCPALTELRDTGKLPPPARDAHVQQVAARLQLTNLASFYERVTRTSL